MAFNPVGFPSILTEYHFWIFPRYFGGFFSVFLCLPISIRSTHIGWNVWQLTPTFPHYFLFSRDTFLSVSALPSSPETQICAPSQCLSWRPSLTGLMEAGPLPLSKLTHISIHASKHVLWRSHPREGYQYFPRLSPSPRIQSFTMSCLLDYWSIHLLCPAPTLSPSSGSCFLSLLSSLAWFPFPVHSMYSSQSDSSLTQNSRLVPLLKIIQWLLITPRKEKNSSTTPDKNPFWPGPHLISTCAFKESWFFSYICLHKMRVNTLTMTICRLRSQWSQQLLSPRSQKPQNKSDQWYCPRPKLDL